MKKNNNTNRLVYGTMINNIDNNKKIEKLNMKYKVHEACHYRTT